MEVMKSRVNGGWARLVNGDADASRGGLVPWKSSFVAACVLGFLVLAGCVAFDEQTLRYRYDAATDTMRVFQEYQGIHAEAVTPTQEEKEQFESLFTGERTFFFNNWITEYNREQVQKWLARLRDPVGRTEMELPDGAAPRLENLLTNLTGRVRVENGPFYLDTRRRLCGVQYVTITHWSEVMAAMNAYGPYLLRTLAAESDTKPADRVVMLRYADNPRPMIQMDGNQLVLRFPMTPLNFKTAFGPVESPDSAAAVLLKAGVSVTFSDEVATFRLGGRSDSVTSVTLPFKTNAYTGNLIELAKSRHVVADRLDSELVAKGFLLNGRKPAPSATPPK